MTITIHRGTHQIGGCVTDIRTEHTRILIDAGSELPGIDGSIAEETLVIPGVTEGEIDCDAVFFTHSHGDHIGQITRIPDSVPLYMGETAKELALILSRRLDKAGIPGNEKVTAAYERAITFKMAQTINVGDIAVTPYWIDHSAFDAYMFLIEAEGKRILHTGDFRLHGFRGSKTIDMLSRYVGRVDCLICEGTMLSRDTEEVMTERELQTCAKQLLRENKKVFVLCSSMNIDRIAGFIHALDKEDSRPIVCDPFQRDVLQYVEQHHGDKSSLYRFGKLLCNKNHLLHDMIEEQGCLAFIRANRWSQELLNWFDDGLIVYSMWDGYLEKPEIKKLLTGRNYRQLHTSGHATAEAIRSVVDCVKPDLIIPLHTENQEAFCKLFPDKNVERLNDKQKFEY